MYDVKRFSNIRDLDVIFDVGANIGQTASGLVRHFPNSRIYCFEPVYASFDQLMGSCGGYPNVTCIHSALGSAAAEKTIRLRKQSETNSFLEVAAAPEQFLDVSETVTLQTVDAFCAARGITSIDILKMDVQGWETEVLAGASSMLTANKIRFVFAEVGFRPGNTEMQTFGELEEVITDYGFLFSGFYELFRYGDAKQFTLFANALYLNPNFEK